MPYFTERSLFWYTSTELKSFTPNQSSARPEQDFVAQASRIFGTLLENDETFQVAVKPLSSIERVVGR